MIDINLYEFKKNATTIFIHREKMDDTLQLHYLNKIRCLIIITI